jgi:hypothetical protein
MGVAFFIWLIKQPGAPISFKPAQKIRWHQLKTSELEEINIETSTKLNPSEY